MKITKLLSSSMAINALATAMAKLDGGQEALNLAIQEVKDASKAEKSEEID